MKEKAIYILNSIGIGSNLIAWIADNPAFVMNLLLFAIPTAIFTILRGRQRLRQESELHKIEVMRKKQELQQDQDLHKKNMGDE